MFVIKKELIKMSILKQKQFTDCTFQTLIIKLYVFTHVL
jgi:hypothetical protein